MLYKGDDESYMAHATSIVFLQFPSYAKESFSMGEVIPVHFIGPSLLALPFIIIFSTVDRLLGSPIVVQRTVLNVSQSWSVFGFTISSLFYLWLTCLFLYKGLKLFFPSWISSLTVVLSALVQGVPLFAFRRPAFTHIYEIFLQSLLLFFLFRLLKFGHILPQKIKLRYWKESALVGIIIGLICLVRLNNIFLALAWPLILFSVYYPVIPRGKILRMSLFAWFFILVLMTIFVFWPMRYNLHHISASDHLYFRTFLVLLSPQTITFYLNRLWGLLFGLDFGLIFSAPYLLLGLVSFFWIRKSKVSHYLLMLLIPLLVNLYLVICIGCIGSWYGYRYLVFSLLPVTIYPLACTLSMLEEKNRIAFLVILAILTIFPVLSMVSFEGNNANLTLKVVDEGFGVLDWGNNTYQLEIYKMILTRPIQYLGCVFKGGVCYLAYLFSILTKQNNLPMIIYEKYEVFKLTTLIKTLIVYIFPFFLLSIYNRLISKNTDDVEEKL
jgi:hypothetical protein